MKRIAPAAAILFLIACRHEPPFDRAAYEKDVMQWRQHRAARLQSEDSWLSLVGLDWLHEGSNELKLPGGPAGTVVLQNGKTTLEPSRDSGLTIDGKPVAGPVDLLNDFDPKGPTVVKRSSAQFQIIKRDPRYAVRVKDAQSDARLHFKGLEYFPIDPKWRIVAKFEPYNPPKKVPITNVLGMTGDEVSPGALVFTVDGKEYRIDPINEQGEEDLFIIIKDQTSRDATYPAGRYLYAKHPGPDGTTIVDFNKAYNPPCTFTPFATCPLPPKQNILPFRIEVGEKRYAGGHH
ncbi:MAG TPA: DUF1684 domain-containing protein [Thermoanaerobaculia bacterium]|nr:DUF1684 domain-containing protein [Thermoanaerobaculia bacterium]